jgi:hypothetical protein
VADLSGRVAVRFEERVRARTASWLVRQVGELGVSTSADTRKHGLPETVARDAVLEQIKA